MKRIAVCLMVLIFVASCGAPADDQASSESVKTPIAEAKTASASKIYQEKCVLCHGDKGRGDGPATSGLPKQPLDFTDKKSMSKISDGELIKKIKQGKPSSGMPAWGDILSAEEVQALAKYLRDFSK